MSQSPGLGLQHNPGVAMLWITKTYRPWQVPGEAIHDAGVQPGVLFEMGEPLVIECHRGGREATRTEIAAGPWHAATGPRRGASRLPVSSACGNYPSQPLPLVGEHDGAVAGALEVRSSLDDRATRKGRPVLLKVVTRSLAVMGPFSPCGLSLTGTVRAWETVARLGSFPAMRTSYNRIAGQSIERLAALSDGIFAVAMTLLVLDLHAPARATVHTEHELWHALVAMAPQLITYLLSFVTLGIFWTRQQTQLHHVARGDRQ